jgi:hypothetical protein
MSQETKTAKYGHKEAAITSAAALVLGRVLQRVGQNLAAADMITRGQTLEIRASEALRQGRTTLPPTT